MAGQMHKRELQEIKIEYEAQIRDFKQQLGSKETHVKDLQIQMESLKID